MNINVRLLADFPIPRQYAVTGTTLVTIETDSPNTDEEKCLTSTLLGRYGLVFFRSMSILLQKDQPKCHHK